MAKYSQNNCGATCPWGSADTATDAFSLAALKAERRRSEAAPEVVASARSAQSEKPKVVEVDVEGRMMQLIEKCLEKKVLEIDLKRTHFLKDV